MPYLRARLAYCLSRDLPQRVKGEVITPRPGNSMFEADDGSSGRESEGRFDQQVAVWSVAAGASMLGLVIVGAGPLARHLRRRRRRYICALDVYMSSAAGTGDGQILDISLVGAKIRKGEFLAEVGDRVQLSTDVFHETCQVIWCNAHYLGVRFRHPLKRDQIKRAVATKPIRQSPTIEIGESVEA